MGILGNNKDGSTVLREQYYQYAFNYFSEQPVFGIGLAHFAVRNPHHTYAHSTYAEVLADWGIVGSIIYLLPAIWAGLMLFKKIASRSAPKTATVVLGFWIMQVFLGIGQIWFYEIELLIAWTIIYLYVDSLSIEQNKIRRIPKYVKDYNYV